MNRRLSTAEMMASAKVTKMQGLSTYAPNRRQIPVSGWYQLFGDSTYADACLSRMTSKAYRLEFPGRDRRVNNGN